jgi:hypothetical protein
VAEQGASQTSWLAHKREQRRLKREQAGDSPEKAAGHHTPPDGVIDRMLKLGGVERESHFKK